MPPLTRRALFAGMVIWTAVIAASGWWALSGTISPASAGRGSPSSPTPAATATSTATLTRGYAPPLATPIPALPPDEAVDGERPLGTRPLNPDSPRDGEAGPRRRGVIVLDPGHGRGDPGAVAYRSDGTVLITEAELNQRNAELIRDRLVAMGYDVYLTRQGAGAGPDGGVPLQFITSDLYARVGLARAVDADVYLALHGNGATVRTISGPETWYCGRHAAGSANEKLARMVQQAMMDALAEYRYFPPDRGIKEDASTHHSGEFCQFVVTRENDVPSALLEFLFLSNPADAKVLADKRSHELLAKHVAAALDRFLQEQAAAE
jgi:N-acetylmuramoyl-L-alanine amidase